MSMISRLQLLQNIGQFDSVACAAKIPLAPLTLVYAENGRGKTTLVSVLRSLMTGDPIPIAERHRFNAQHPSHVIIGCDGEPSVVIFQNNAWDRTLPNMMIFDDLFVDENVYSGLAVGPEHRKKLHELILGAQGVSLAHKVDALAKKITEHNGVLHKKAAEIPSAERGAMNVDDFCALENQADIDDALQGAQRIFAAIREQEAIRTQLPFDVVTLPDFDGDALSTLLQRDLPNLDAEAGAQVRAHIETLGGGGEAWVADGLHHVSPEANATCPFCAQSLDGSRLISHYRAYFSQGYADFKDHISAALKDMDKTHAGDPHAAFERAIRMIVEQRQFWALFCDVPEVSVDTATIVQSWREAHDAVETLLQRKQAAPLERLDLDQETQKKIAAFRVFRDVIADLNKSLRTANDRIRGVKEQAAGGDVKTAEQEVARLKAIKARFGATTARLCDEYLKEKAAKTETEQQHMQAREELDVYRDKVFPACQSAINTHLKKFNAGFSIKSMASTNPGGRASCNYCLVINGAQVAVGGGNSAPGDPCFKNTLSSGDRSSLALAFFFAALDQDPNLETKIVVLDDPMSSLDEHRSLTTVQDIRELAKRVNQVIVLSHEKPFLCQIWEHHYSSDKVALHIVRDGAGSTITSWDVTAESVTEYDRNHAMLREFVVSSTNNLQEVARVIRLVMDGFLRVACTEYFPPGKTLGQFITEVRKQSNNNTSPILSDYDIRELVQITEYTNKFHHDTNPAWESETINDSQLVGYVKRTLKFVRPSRNDHSFPPSE